MGPAQHTPIDTGPLDDQSTRMSKPGARLKARLKAIDGKGYGAYKSIADIYDFDDYILYFDHVQSDPFAAPTRLRLVIPPDVARLPPDALTNRRRRVACADYLNRLAAAALQARSRQRGSGVSGIIGILQPGQQILERTSLQVDEEGKIVVRLTAGLPAEGRRVRADDAVAVLMEDVPGAIRHSLVAGAFSESTLLRHVRLAEDSSALRAQLADHGLVAFVREGAVLPRRSGIDDTPLARARAVAFESPESLRVELRASAESGVTGMGVPQGVTLIVGGGYHGKSTLLRALERGVYDHIENDGRELVVSVASAVKVRAEDGRRIAGVDISNFINGLPGGEDTRRFDTDNASGSTSQAATIVEALEVGTSCLLMDEDTSATNFMIRDARMQALIHDDAEPITPFIDRAKQLYDELGVSSVIVVGGAGDYFDIADTVIGMNAYKPADLTLRAKQIAASFDTQRNREGGTWMPLRTRIPQPASINSRKGKKAVSIRVPTQERILFGTEELDLSAVEQIVELAQARAIAQALAYGSDRWIDGKRSLLEGLRDLCDEIHLHGLDVIDSRSAGNYAEFRIYELAAALNRLRTLRIESGSR